MARVEVNESEVRALTRDPGVVAGLSRVGGQIADRARAAAPKDTGAGAASISHEVAADSDGAEVRVSWDSAHSYMLFNELGTSKMPARPFLRPALDGNYDI